MIKHDRYKKITDDEKAQYKFSFCKLCDFYECELIKEYMLFNKNNPVMATQPVVAITIKGDNNVHPSVAVAKVQLYNKENDTSPSLSYSPNELACGCSMQRFVQVECGRKKVADGIGDDFKANIRRYTFKIESDTDKYKPERPGKWEPKQPVFISAQTGQGKNYFIENELLPYVREMNIEIEANQKVLIISNRIALKLQIKNRLSQGANYQEADSFENYKGYPADVMTYQGILNKVEYLKKKQENKHSSYTFVVCDEAHFFTSDAMFNPDTEKILSAIVTTFQDAIRVYMSATPYECLEYIKKCEGTYATEPQLGVFYHFKRDYNYLDVEYYSHHSELAELIAESVCKNSEKWLIFIDDIEKGKDFKDKLEDYPDMKSKVFAVDAKCKDNEDYQKMVLSEAFVGKTKVLISTSVLDNGVNFRDIQNIVISDIDKAKCLQMVGRARVASGDDNLTLYMKRFNEEYVGRRIKYFENQEDAYHDYDLMSRSGSYRDKFYDKYFRGNEQDWKNAKHWFGTIKQHQLLPLQNELYPNEIARLLVKQLLERYRTILEEMQRTDGKWEADDDRKVTGQRYLEHQLSWFGKNYEEENDITLVGKGKAEEELINLLESYVGKQMYVSKDDECNEQMEFRKKFTNLANIAYGAHGPNKGRDYGLTVINDIFEIHTMNYRVASDRAKDSTKRTYWTVIRLDQETDGTTSE